MYNTAVVDNTVLTANGWSFNKVREITIVFLSWRHGTKTLVWFDDFDISKFYSCIVLYLRQSLMSGMYYCLRVFWCAAARMSELELEQRTDIKFLVKFGKSSNEIRRMLVQGYGDSAMKNSAVYK